MCSIVLPTRFCVYEQAPLHVLNIRVSSCHPCDDGEHFPANYASFYKIKLGLMHVLKEHKMAFLVFAPRLVKAILTSTD